MPDGACVYQVIQGDYSQQTLFEVLLRAASHHDSIEHTTEILDGTPTGNGIRHHLNKLDDMILLETQVNAALQSQMFSETKLWNKGSKIILLQENQSYSPSERGTLNPAPLLLREGYCWRIIS